MPTLTRSKPPATASAPTHSAHTVKPSTGPGGNRVDPDVAEIRFHPAKTATGLGTIEVVLGLNVVNKINLRGLAIFRISTDLANGRIEATSDNTVGALKANGAKVKRIRVAARGFPAKVAEAISYATIPPMNTAARPPFVLKFTVIDGGLEFKLPAIRAQRSRP